ncbi:MAG: hypothetical protein ACLFP9_05900 [Desulfonatronovibrio sp.]
MDQNNNSNAMKKRVEPDFFPPGSKVCFLCLSNQGLAQTMGAIFKDNGFLATETQDIEIAVQKLRLNQYQVIVIEAGSEFRKLFQEINSWPGHTRRETNLIVMGQKAPSLHQQMAFIMGANYYLNVNDTPEMKKLIKQVLDGYDEYYQPWNQAREVIDAN